MLKIYINAPQRQLYAHLHDAEMGPLWRIGLPEVYVIAEIKTEFIRELQIRSYEINTTANPLVTEDMTGEKWRVVYDDHRWATNGTGYDGNSPYADWVNGRDLQDENPKMDKYRAMGGQLFAGKEVYSVTQTLRDTASLLFKMATSPRSLSGRVQKSISSLVANNMLEIECINIYDGIPKLSYILDRPWLFMDLVNVTANGISRFPQGTNFNRVFGLNVASKQGVRYSLSRLRKLPLGYNAKTHDPYKINS